MLTTYSKPDVNARLAAYRAADLNEQSIKGVQEYAEVNVEMVYVSLRRSEFSAKSRPTIERNAVQLESDASSHLKRRVLSKSKCIASNEITSHFPAISHNQNRPRKASIRTKGTSQKERRPLRDSCAWQQSDQTHEHYLFHGFFSMIETISIIPPQSFNTTISRRGR